MPVPISSFTPPTHAVPTSMEGTVIIAMFFLFAMVAVLIMIGKIGDLIFEFRRSRR